MILTIGSINTDICLNLRRIPSPGENEKALSVIKTPGGKGANQAVAAAKAGAEVCIIGCVGADDNGQMMLSSLESAGVSTASVYRLDGTATSTAYILVDPNGENLIVVDSSANMHLTCDKLYENEQLFEQAEFCILQHEIPLETVKAALDLCKKHGVCVFLNPSPLSPNSVEYISSVQYLIPNEHEAAALLNKRSYSEITPEEWQQFLIDHDIENIIVTLGSEGCTHFSRQSQAGVHYESKKMNAVDTTGAGDTFLGTLAASIAKGEEIAQAIKIASTAAGIAVTRHGAQAAMPTWDEISQALKV